MAVGTGKMLGRRHMPATCERCPTPPYTHTSSYSPACDLVMGANFKEWSSICLKRSSICLKHGELEFSKHTR